MLLAAALSICSMIPSVVDDTIRLRDAGVPEQEVRQAIKDRPDMPEELRTRSLGVVNVVYALPPGTDSSGAKLQIVLTCNNSRVIRGHQYPSERSRRGAGSRSGDEQHRRERAEQSWDRTAR